MTFRVLVMLCCLVAIPMVAMFGDALLDGVSRFLEQWWVNTATAAKDHSAQAATSRVGIPEPPGSQELARSRRLNFPPDSGDPPFDQLMPIVSARRGQTPSEGEELAGVEHRLRQLGATYYRLESWGDGGQWFRFQCRVAVDGNPGCTKHFEATDRVPVQAIAVVFHAVESWLRTEKSAR
jgi:hypothetical protein